MKNSTFFSAIILTTWGVHAGAVADPVQFTVTASATSSQSGFISGQSITFNFVTTADFINNASSSFSSTTNLWREQTTVGGKLWADVEIDGATGTYNQPIPSSGVSVYSFISMENDTLNIVVSNDMGGSLGLLTPAGQAITFIQAGFFTPSADFSYSGAYTAPKNYFSGYTDTYTYTPSTGGLSLSAGSSGTIFFDITKLTISPVPEPATYAMFAGLIVLGLAASRRSVKRV